MFFLDPGLFSLTLCQSLSNLPIHQSEVSLTSLIPSYTDLIIPYLIILKQTIHLLH